MTGPDANASAGLSLRARLTSRGAGSACSSCADAVVVGEVPAVPGDFAQLVVERLERVGGVDDLADLGREGEERDHALPGVAPHAGDRRVARAPGLVELVERRGGAGLAVGAVDGPW